MRRRRPATLAWTAAAAAAAAALAAASCGERIDGLQPVGGGEPSTAELERFARRLHLDLTGQAPGDGYVADAVARLQEGGNSAAARQALADELLDDERFAETFVAELENRVFAGETLVGQYNFVCGIVRGNTPACMSCGAPPADNFCADCACEVLRDLDAERSDLLDAADDLHDGDRTTGEVERAFAASLVFRALLGAPQAIATSLFEQFLGRPAEPEELDNASRIVTGSLLGPQFPAGLLFHRHGKSYDDLIDILFTSEAYRESVVNRVFERYLGRRASPEELVHFAGQLDEDAPDAEPVIRAVVSSREYFEQ